MRTFIRKSTMAFSIAAKNTNLSISTSFGFLRSELLDEVSVTQSEVFRRRKPSFEASDETTSWRIPRRHQSALLDETEISLYGTQRLVPTKALLEIAT
jgi:hypothetical protein